ncbi:MAG: PIN/TRAM domain-containing protein [Deltaproteobacteria bacterium]
MNMTLLFVRVLFLVCCTLVGFQVGDANGINVLVTTLAGFGIGLLIMILEVGMRGISVRGLSSAVFGLILGLVIARLLTQALFTLFPLDQSMSDVTAYLLTLSFSYIGMTIALRGRDEFNLIIPYVKFRRQEQVADAVLLDTSAIIDGRIADIIKSRFLDARIVVPRFVLKELQVIADSADAVKRQRGRRGLEILHMMRSDNRFSLMIHEEDFSDVPDVDAKLVKLAKVLEARIVTVDFNLNRIAELQNVKVLNINEIANALRSVVLPGEAIEVKPMKEGKEHNQAVAYLQDGTMVVVEDARRYIGQTIKVMVTSVLQTQAGRMVFARPESPTR